MTPIKHVFVLMMENRSFDHLLGLSGINGVVPPDPRLWPMTNNAPDQEPDDPPHEFEDVAAQIAGDPPMSGFKKPANAAAMRGFTPASLPVLTTLARQYFLFDNWYSSLPGPTWPNRFFVHAATSGGLDNSPSPVTTLASETIDSLSFTFENGTIFEKIEDMGRKWRVYHEDYFPQVLAIRHMIDPFRRNTDHFRWTNSGKNDLLRRDLRAGYDVDYTFIEPDYAITSGDFSASNCQHPKGSVARGEALIKRVYETIRNSPVWDSSVLVITYDEHGGFFDHREPPAAQAPGDDDRNRQRAEKPQRFAFDRLGVRVPTIVISPWVAKGGLGSRTFPGQNFDHGSLVHTVRELFNLGGQLTDRDGSAPSFASILSAGAMRTDPADVPATLPDPYFPPAPLALVKSRARKSSKPDAMLKGFTRIAMSIDLSTAQATKAAPLAKSHPLFALAAVPGKKVPKRKTPPLKTSAQMRDYIRTVAANFRNPQQ